MLSYLNHQKTSKILLIFRLMNKLNQAYKTIGEVVKILDLKTNLVKNAHAYNKVLGKRI